jgi:hypothetical protein
VIKPVEQAGSVGLAAHRLPELLRAVHVREWSIGHRNVEEAAQRRPAFRNVEHQQPLRRDCRAHFLGGLFLAWRGHRKKERRCGRQYNVLSFEHGLTLGADEL